MIRCAVAGPMPGSIWSCSAPEVLSEIGAEGGVFLLPRLDFLTGEDSGLEPTYSVGIASGNGASPPLSGIGLEDFATRLEFPRRAVPVERIASLLRCETKIWLPSITFAARFNPSRSAFFVGFAFAIASLSRVEVGKV